MYKEDLPASSKWLHQQNPRMRDKHVNITWVADFRMLRIPVLVVWSWGSWFLLLVSFWSSADWSDQNCLQQEKWISGGKTFDILCLFCRSYELICAWKGWLYASLWKLLFVFLYHWHFSGLWTTFLQIIMSIFNVMNFHHLFYKTCT
jgi:hypothetical protein